MKNVNISDLKYKCVRCNHAWIIRQPKVPTVCPRCKLPWDKKGRGLGWRRGVLKFYDTKTKKYFVTNKYKKVQLMTEKGKKYFLKAKSPSGVDAFRLIGASSSTKYIKTGD